MIKPVDDAADQADDENADDAERRHARVAVDDGCGKAIGEHEDHAHRQIKAAGEHRDRLRHRDKGQERALVGRRVDHAGGKADFLLPSHRRQT